MTEQNKPPTLALGPALPPPSDAPITLEYLIAQMEEQLDEMALELRARKIVCAGLLYQVRMFTGIQPHPADKVV